MTTPFQNDIFSMIYQAFKNLYPDKDCQCFWEPEIEKSEDGEQPLGVTCYGEDGTIYVFVDPKLSVVDAGEILAHELAHVAVGMEHNHDETWEAAFNAIHAEYNRMGEEQFDRHTGVSIQSGKDYVRESEVDSNGS